MCSGSEITTVAAEAPEQSLLSVDVKHTFQTMFMCEKVPKKQQWCMEIVEDESACCFQDVMDMGKPVAWCTRHKKMCPVIRVEGLIAGTSCKDHSKANMHRGKINAAGPVLRQKNLPGNSANTMQGVLDYVDVHAPDWVLMENSDTLREGDHLNADLVQAEFSSRGYEISPHIVDTGRYGLPEHRRRSWFLALLVMSRIFRISCWDFFFKEFAHWLKVSRRQPPDLIDVVFATNHPSVQAELAERLKKKPVPIEPSSASQHQKAYQMKKLRWGAESVQKTTSKSQWFNTLTGREQDLLPYFQKTVHKDSRLVTGADIGQSIESIGKTTIDGGKLLAPTLIPGSKIWLMFGQKRTDPKGAMKEERLLLGEEMMMIQGFPVTRISRRDIFDQNFYADLAGNSFSGTVILAMLASLVAATPWVQDDGDEEISSSADVAAALAAAGF